jgi:hypothetical protein
MRGPRDSSTHPGRGCILVVGSLSNNGRVERCAHPTLAIREIWITASGNYDFGE